jgi:hypothetical protein
MKINCYTDHNVAAPKTTNTCEEELLKIIERLRFELNEEEEVMYNG